MERDLFFKGLSELGDYFKREDLFRKLNPTLPRKNGSKVEQYLYYMIEEGIKDEEKLKEKLYPGKEVSLETYLMVRLRAYRALTNNLLMLDEGFLFKDRTIRLNVRALKEASLPISLIWLGLNFAANVALYQGLKWSNREGRELHYVKHLSIYNRIKTMIGDFRLTSQNIIEEMLDKISRYKYHLELELALTRLRDYRSKRYILNQNTQNEITKIIEGSLNRRLSREGRLFLSRLQLAILFHEGRYGQILERLQEITSETKRSSRIDKLKRLEKKLIELEARISCGQNEVLEGIDFNFLIDEYSFFLKRDYAILDAFLLLAVRARETKIVSWLELEYDNYVKPVAPAFYQKRATLFIGFDRILVNWNDVREIRKVTKEYKLLSDELHTDLPDRQGIGFSARLLKFIILYRLKDYLKLIDLEESLVRYKSRYLTSTCDVRQRIMMDLTIKIIQCEFSLIESIELINSSSRDLAVFENPQRQFLAGGEPVNFEILLDRLKQLVQEH